MYSSDDETALARREYEDERRERQAEYGYGCGSVPCLFKPFNAELFLKIVADERKAHYDSARQALQIIRREVRKPRKRRAKMERLIDEILNGG